MAAQTPFIIIIDNYSDVRSEQDEDEDGNREMIAKTLAIPTTTKTGSQYKFERVRANKAKDAQDSFTPRQQLAGMVGILTTGDSISESESEQVEKDEPREMRTKPNYGRVPRRERAYSTRTASEGQDIEATPEDVS